MTLREALIAALRAVESWTRQPNWRSVGDDDLLALVPEEARRVLYGEGGAASQPRTQAGEEPASTTIHAYREALGCIEAMARNALAAAALARENRENAAEAPNPLYQRFYQRLKDQP